jgi:hypothetical protein
MNTTVSESLGLLASLREITEVLAGLDLAALPKIYAVDVKPEFSGEGLAGSAQLYSSPADDGHGIDAIRAWAVALGAVVLLGDEVEHKYGAYRRLAAVLRLPSGRVFEVWRHLTELRPSPDWTPADSDLIVA